MKPAINLFLLVALNLIDYSFLPAYASDRLPTKNNLGKTINFNRSVNEINYEVDVHNFDLSDENALFLLEADSSFIYGGERSELAFFSPYQVGDIITYDFTFRLRKSLAFSKGWSAGWVLFAQWHDQPVKSRGETWQTFPKNSPPLSYQLFFEDGLKVGIVSKNFQSLFPVELETPMTCTTTIMWQYPNNSNVKGFCTQGDNMYNFDFNDMLMLNDYYHYFKFGLYRKRSIDGFMAIELIELSIH